MIVIFLLLVVIFAVQNAHMVTINFLMWSFSLNQALVVLGSLSVGLVVGAAWLWLKDARVRGQVKELTKALEAEQKKVATLERTLQEEIEKKKEYESRSERQKQN